jgi:serine/threonine-protein kinase CTR1
VTASPDWLIVTELLHGSLYKLLHGQTRPVPPSVLRRIAKDVACGAAYIHGLSPSIVHRDINSSNVLLTGDINVLERIVEEGRNEPLAKLSDFGLSRSVERFMTQCTGNAYYLAPGKAHSPTNPHSRRRQNPHA